MNILFRIMLILAIAALIECLTGKSAVEVPHRRRPVW